MEARLPIFFLMMLFQFAVPTESAFWPDRPTYWWRLNYTSVDACSLTPYCSIETKIKEMMPTFAGAFHFTFTPSDPFYAPFWNYSVSPYEEPPAAVLRSDPMPPPPVNVTLYYESLCPDCKNIFKYQIFPTYKKLASTRVLNLQLVPFGNGKVFRYGEKFLFTCQHGAAECLGNKIETCAISYVSEPALVPFIYCLEYYGPTVANGKHCSHVHRLPWQPIENCINGPEGDELEYRMAEKTQALTPAHTFVPWFTVNGVHTDEIQQGLEENMLGTVCKLYTGPKPEECM